MRFMRFVMAGLLLAAAVCIPLGRDSRIGGTFIAAIIARDGIVVGADSRSTFLDAAGRSLGYVDGTRKIYVSNTTAVAVSGLTSVDGDLFNAFVDKNAFLLDRAADEVLFGMSAWLPFRNSTGVLLLSAGFVQSKPTVCLRSAVQPQWCRTSGFMVNQPSPSLQAWFQALPAAPLASAAAAALKQAILESAAADVRIGGPITIVQMTPEGSPVRLENPSLPAWKTVCDIIRDYRAARARIVATGSPPELDRYLRSVACPG